MCKTCVKHSFKHMVKNAMKSIFVFNYVSINVFKYLSFTTIETKHVPSTESQFLPCQKIVLHHDNMFYTSVKAQFHRLFCDYYLNFWYDFTSFTGPERFTNFSSMTIFFPIFFIIVGLSILQNV